MTREFIDFVNAHKDDDTARLLLSAARYPSIDMPAAVQQIEGLRTARDKWPSLLACEDYQYPPRLNREQASSEAAARYKASIISPLISLNLPFTVADLTGGMGIDTLAFARVAQHVDYVERDPQLCALMEHNLEALGIGNVTVHCVDSMEWLMAASKYDLLFVDPARRAASGRKVAAFEDCTPNILEHMGLLRSRCDVLMVKASPMIDIDLGCRQLGNVNEVHVVGVKGECKEVLFVCGEPQPMSANSMSEGEPRIICGEVSFTRSEEAATKARYCQAVWRYLYEPDAVLMKGGPFKIIAERYGLEQLGRNTHLYTSERRVDGFPGRVFEVLQELKLSRKEVAAAIPDGKAHVVTRNYPVEAAALQKQLGLREGGDIFVVATSIGNRKCGFLCKM